MLMQWPTRSNALQSGGCGDIGASHIGCVKQDRMAYTLVGLLALEDEAL